MTIVNNKNLKKHGVAALMLFSIVVGLFVYSGFDQVSAQTRTNDLYRSGEKITYVISFEKYQNAAYAEVFVASKGTIQGKPVVELQAKLKSINFVSAAYYLFDHARTVYSSEETGFPLYVKDTSNLRGFPVETFSNFLSAPSTNLDLLTLFYKVRENGGAGSFSVLEGEQLYGFDFASTGGETVKTPSGSYETSVSVVTSSYWEQFGITNVRVNFTADEERIPVQIRITTPKGTFLAQVASYSKLTPLPAPTTVTASTPVPTATPVPTPTPYIENQPLSEDFPFRLGERLHYSLTQNNTSIAKIVLTALARKELEGQDTLVLSASVSDPGNGSIISSQDSLEAWVDPLTLVPRGIDIKLAGSLKDWSQRSVFDQTAGIITFGGTNSVEAPIGTHSLLSFAFAVRSFNLRPSLDPKNPVNDTRVSVFANDRAYILTLRPAANEKIEIGGRKINAQLITIITGDAEVDRLRPRLWLSTDADRVPLRFSIGSFQADLIK